MWPDRVSNPGPLTYELGALPTALRGPATNHVTCVPREDSGLLRHLPSLNRDITVHLKGS